MKIILHVLTGAEIINTEDIIFCKAKGRNTLVVVKTNIERQKEFISIFSLKKVQELVPQQFFFRSSRGALINWAHFTGFNTPEDKVILTDEFEIPISRIQKAKFKEEFAIYLNWYNSNK